MPFLIAVSLLLQTFCFAISEENYQQVWSKQVLPHYENSLPEFMTNDQNMSLHFRHFTKPDNKKVLVILPGRSEPAKKYAEVIYDLRNDGYDIFILDHQGQGRSQRLLADSQPGHVIQFSDYVNDVESFVNEVVIPRSQGRKMYLLAHSMGGGIAAHYLARNPELFEKVVLNAPMMELNTGKYSEFKANLITFTMVTLHKGAEYAKGKGPYLPENDTFESNDTTHSVARHEAEKFLNVSEPQYLVAGPTYRWVNQGLKATKKIHLTAKLIKSPILMFQAGQDMIVKLERQNTFCALSTSCKKILFPEARHEMLMEVDSIRNEAFKEMRAFLK